MLQSLQIKNLRGIRDGLLEGLGTVSVLVGPNSSGKSTVLDALLIGADPAMSYGLATVLRRRDGLKRGVDWLAWRGNKRVISGTVVSTDQGVVITRTFVRASANNRYDDVLEATQRTRGTAHNFESTQGRIHLNELGAVQGTSNLTYIGEGVLPTVRLVDCDGPGTLSPLHELYTEVVRQGRRKPALSIIGDVIPGLVGLEILTEDNEPIIYLVFDDYAVPAAVAGEGVQALIRTSLELAASPGGLVLLEEPEIHLHPRAIWQTARAIWAAINRDVQVVLSTHSLELIDALLSVVSDPAELERMAVFRLLLEDGQLKSSRITGMQAAEARSTIEEDLR